MTTEEIIERLKEKFFCGFSIHDCDKCEIESCLDRDILNATIEALKTSDKAVDRAIDKIASELKHWIQCYRCPLDCQCKIWDNCEALLALWLKGIVEEVKK